MIRFLAVALVLAAGPLRAAGIAVTIDDLPLQAMDGVGVEDVARINERLVAALSDGGIPAVGFVNESKLEVKGRTSPERVAVLELWLRSGLELGNHTFSHSDLHRNSAEAFIEDIERGERITRSLARRYGRPYRYFRHPFLHTGRDPGTRVRVRDWLAEHGYAVAPVTIDNSEWIYAAAYERAHERGDGAVKERLAQSYLDYMTAKTAYFARNGRELFRRDIPQVLLVHANRLNADWFRELADRLSEEGHEFISLEAALADPAYASTESWMGEGGISWLHRWALGKGASKSFFEGEPEVPEWVMKYSGVGAE